MKLISKSRVFDVGYLNNWGAIQDRMRSIINDSPLQFASTYAKWEKVLIKNMEKTIESYKDLKN